MPGGDWWVQRSGQLIQLYPGGKQTETLPPVSGGSWSQGLFFELPDNMTDRYAHKSYPHWWPYTVRSWDNASTESADWYSTQLNNPNSSSYASSQSYGGASRYRPMFRPAISGGSAVWNEADRVFDIETAIAYGHDGFFCDIIQSWKSRIDQLATALRNLRSDNPGGVYDDFVLIPMIDANSPTVYSSASVAGDYLLQFADVTKYTENGEMLWAVWHPGSGSANGFSTWNAISSYMASQGVPNKFIGCWNTSYTNGTTGPAAYTSITYAEGPWGAGGADPANVINARATINGYSAAAHGRSKRFLHPVRAHEIRSHPDQGFWWQESANLEALVEGWTSVIANTGPNDWCQPVTWSDYTEATSFAPSTHAGYAYVMVSAYYLARWKTGAWPTITRDAVIVSHRQHMLGANVSYSGETNTLPQNSNSPRTTGRNKVEARVFLTAPATVRIIDAAGSHDFSAPAGHSAYTVNMTVGVAPKVEIWRNSAKVTEVQSTQAIVATPWRSDQNYWCFTNLHDTTYQSRIPGPNPPYA